MKTIRNLKKQARLRAVANGTPHQAELNALAREKGFATWGDLQRSLRSARPSPSVRPYEPISLEEAARMEEHYERLRYNLQPIDDPDAELQDMLDGCAAARRVRGHLVVARPTEEREVEVIELLWMYQDENPRDPRLEGIAFTPFIDPVAIEHANSHGQTLVAGSGGMHREASNGLFLVHNAKQKLSQLNALYSKRDKQVIDMTLASAIISQHVGESQPEPSSGRPTIRWSSRPLFADRSEL
ncbi:hypothetical protein [Sphingomonas sp. 3-13AW]|uniref:hypothetical protein n=1 Tax=Sphingomonas sp. 3-13AW TaxID=3050450 RepID=UPI003BB63480